MILSETCGYLVSSFPVSPSPSLCDPNSWTMWTTMRWSFLELRERSYPPPAVGDGGGGGLDAGLAGRGERGTLSWAVVSFSRKCTLRGAGMRRESFACSVRTRVHPGAETKEEAPRQFSGEPLKRYLLRSYLYAALAPGSTRLAPYFSSFLRTSSSLLLSSGRISSATIAPPFSNDFSKSRATCSSTPMSLRYPVAPPATAPAAPVPMAAPTAVARAPLPTTIP